MSHQNIPKAPNLVLTEPEYNIQNESQFRNQLRLYFNQLDDTNQTLYGGVGGYHLNFPHISAYSASDLYATADNTATKVVWSAADDVQGFTLNANSTATPDHNGTYKIEYRLQAVNTDNTSAHDIVFWMQIDGVDLANSATKFTIIAAKSASNPSYQTLAGFITWEATAGEEVALFWATEKAYSTSGPVNGVYLEYEAAQTSPYAHPAIPSAYGIIQYIGRD